MKAAWDIHTVISSYWGMYAVQLVFHSLVASVLVDCTFLAWDIRTPAVKQRFRLLVIFLPLASFPLYQMLSPHRGNVYFRLDSLLDSNRWFFLDLGGGFPAFYVFAAVLALTAVVFVVQELVPIVSHMAEQMRGAGEGQVGDVEEAAIDKVSKALESLPLDENSVEILNDDDLVLFSSTGLNPKVYVSTGLIRSFGTGHLEAAFAHEIGHIRRSRKPVFILAYILRVVMFYNPVAMIEFRKLVQEEEKVCDDIAVELTGKPEALSQAVDMLRPAPEDYALGPDSRGLADMASAIEHYGHDVLLKGRIQRIGQRQHDPWVVQYCIALASILSINYFVV